MDILALDSLVRNCFGRRYARSSFLGSLDIPAVTGIAKEIEAEHSRNSPGSRFMIDALAKQILVRVFRSWPGELIRPHEIIRSPQLPRHELVKAVEWMNQTPSDRFTVSNLASSLNRNSSVFSRLFANSAGETPYRFYHDIVMNRASELISHSDRSIKDIALSLGFRSLSHFSSAFRASRNMSPTDYRTFVRESA